MRTILNTTFLIDPAIAKAWVDRMLQVVIPQIKALPPDKDILFTEVMTEAPDGLSFSLQLIFADEEQLEVYEEQSHRSLLVAAGCFSSEQILHFSTILKEITHE